MLKNLFILAIVIMATGSIYSQSEGLKGALGNLQKPTAKADTTIKGTLNDSKLKQLTAADTAGNLQAQNEKGNITFTADSSIVQLEKGKRGFREIKGYRIQLIIGSADLVKKERNNFLSLGLSYSAYLKQIVPEYALQVGDFPTRLEMEKHLEIIRKYYPKAFPVVEVIEPPKFGKR
jgi:hypothetical protein